MPKRLHPFMFLFWLSLSGLSSLPVVGQTPASTPVVDEEYERYKKRGDEYYKQGDYLNARRQYQNCLEVPGFEADAYAKEQIEECATGLILRQQAEEAARQGNSREALRLFVQLLNLNPDDVLTKARLTETYEREGNKLFNQKLYREAKGNYTEALKYGTAAKNETIAIQIENINNILFPKPPGRTGLKIVTGLIAVGAGAGAYLIQRDFESKLSALNQIGQSADLTNSGIIYSLDTYRQYDDAYIAAEAARHRNALYRACLGLAAVATVAELYFLLHRPKPRPHALHWKPASQTWGLALNYTF